MKAEEVFNKWCDTSYPMDFEVFKYLAITAMKEYARLMCDKQKEICKSQAKIRCRSFNEQQGDDVNFWWNQSEHYRLYGDQGNTWGIDVYDINDLTILNAPYPDELQGNN